MTLGDLYWVKLYKLDKDNQRYKDTVFLMDFIKKEFDINLSFLETMTLWEYISGYRCAGWLCVDVYDKEELKDMLGWYLDGDLG